ncbi:Uncharacterized protein SCF082_LOCUS31319 [Durusdinium trenchii]|uniref:EF-hand domain-containing protein n=1 Tax=Durusdinium trenchii TaxID=1381693 RepID=A0ABP0N583_9DINO
MSVMTRETRASAERRRPCSIELTVVLVLEVVIIIASVIILATMGSGDGITFRTDIGALICGLIILLGMLMLALLEIVTNGTKAKEVLLVYLQITIHFNAAALGALTLLGHATWLLAQLLLILAAFAWVVGCCGGAVSLWHWLYYQKVVPKPRMGHLLTLLRALHWKTAFFCWAVLVTLTVVALVFPKLPETVGLSQELSLAEHVLLMGTGGLCYSALFSPLFLALSRRARCTMRRVAGRRKGICLQILIILGLSVVLHFAAGLVIPLAAKEDRDGLDEVNSQMVHRLFELYNYDRHGKLSVDEFVTMRLNQKCSHANVSQDFSEQIKEQSIREFHTQLDANFKPVSYRTFKQYMWRNLKAIEPTDRNAQFLILEGLLIEAQVAREMVERSRRRNLPTILTSIPTATAGTEFSPKRKVAGPPLTGPARRQ